MKTISNTFKSKRSNSLKLNMFWCLSVLFIIFLSIFYIFQVCRITQESYLILSYQEQINELSAKNENLEINLSQNNSLKIIDELIEEMDYEKIGQIHYIKILESSVAAK